MEIQKCTNIQISTYISSIKFSSFSVSPTIAGVGSDGSPEDVTVILNSPTSLVCEAYSYPPATITWFKDGTPLESNRNIRILPGNSFASDAQGASVSSTILEKQNHQLLFIKTPLFCWSCYVLCSPVPNRPQAGTSPWLGDWDPCCKVLKITF